MLNLKKTQKIDPKARKYLRGEFIPEMNDLEKT